MGCRLWGCTELGHDWSNLAADLIKVDWKKAWIYSKLFLVRDIWGQIECMWQLTHKEIHFLFVQVVYLNLNLSVYFSHSVVSDSLGPHAVQHTRLPCSSQTPGDYSNSGRLSQWCHPNISSSCPILLPPSILPSIRGFSSESVLCIRWSK